MYKISILLLILFSGKISSQTLHPTFTLVGNINTENGKILLTPISDSVYYQFGGFHETSIKNGKFFLNGILLYPHAFRLRVEKNSELVYMSDVFFLDTGFQKITCNVDSIWEVPKVLNKPMNELFEGFQNFFQPLLAEEKVLSIRNDSLNRLFGNKINDSIKVSLINEKNILRKFERALIIDYGRVYPNSYLVLWKIIENLNNNGYDVLLDSAFRILTPSIKNSFTGLVLASELKKQSKIAPGNSFPQLFLTNINNGKVKYPQTQKLNKYTLVDFWFSHCGACIAQFNALKELYQNYHSEGFNIVGISIDKKNMLKDWKEVINKYQLPWIQLIDYTGLETKKLSVQSFPTNFLIDNTGKIIARNVELSQLNLLLKNKTSFDDLDKINK